ncbi:mitochondrial glycine transporter [Monosporozyma unispora]|nr:hypothetical protein C6P44_003280 [Kazachstania unispora]
MKDTKNNITKSHSKSGSHLIGGFVGGLTSAVVLQPLDLLKTRIQQQKSATLLSSIRQLNGPLELWRGTLPSALRTSIGSALYLSCLNLMRTKVSDSKRSRGIDMVKSKSSSLPELNVYENLMTGAVARAMVGYITMPITVLKVRYESTMYHYTSIVQATTDIWTKEGINGFFKGFGATCLRDAPYAGLYVLLYEQTKTIVPKLLPKRFITYGSDGNYSVMTSTSINSSSAITAASIATTITAPFDTIKTRMQLEPTKFRNSFQTLKCILTQESILRIFSGLSMRLTRKAISAGIAWSIYEELIKYFTKDNVSS